MNKSDEKLSDTTSGSDRLRREAEAYDDGKVWENNNRWTQRVLHVIECANTQRGEDAFRRLIAEKAAGGSVLDVGCGTGALSAEVYRLGAKSVYGFDVSTREVEEAQAEYGSLEGVSFGVHGADAAIDGQFDAIVGRSVLHHFDFRQVLPQLYVNNLEPGGRMVFMEPMSHPLTLAFHHLVKSAHTPDEWPLTPADIRWFKERFGARILPINLFSFPAGIVSSIFCSSADNSLLRLADKVDEALERRPLFQARGRQGLIVIDRPA